MRSYNELIRLPTFKERFEYLKLNACVGEETFGGHRYFNQRFYQSNEWKSIRRQVIARDYGCDLGLEGYEIGGRIYIHHMNPIDMNDIRLGTEELLSLDNLITVSFETHQAIHYGDDEYLRTVDFSERQPGDTTLW